MSHETIVIVGVGGLGRRHLQGALKSARPLLVRLIDPSQEALDLARQAAKEVLPGNAQTQITYSLDLAGLPFEPDVLIVATSANVRLAVLKAIYKVCRPKALLLEKLLFQDLNEFEDAEKLFGDDLDRVWVNTARRVMHAHHQIKSFFSGTTINGLTASGGLWGMGTSCIHLVDLLDFYQPGQVHAVTTRALDDDIPHSKRPGFREITGTLCGQLGAAYFLITSSPNSKAPLRLFIEAEDRFCVVEESEGRVVFGHSTAGAEIEEKHLRFDYISDTTTVVLEAILTNQLVHLPNFATSAALHRPLLSALGPYFAARLGTPETFVPLT